MKGIMSTRDQISQKLLDAAHGLEIISKPFPTVFQLLLKDETVELAKHKFESSEAGKARPMRIENLREIIDEAMGRDEA